MKKLEIATNVALIIASLALALIAAKTLLTKSPTQLGTAIGEKIRLSSPDWKPDHAATLLLALSTECPYCKRSEPFYRKLLPIARSQDFQTIAWFPQSVEEARSYLSKDNINGIQEVISGHLKGIQIKGTPTLLLIDRSGIVRHEWVGLLPEREEDAVISTLQERSGAK